MQSYGLLLFFTKIRERKALNNIKRKGVLQRVRESVREKDGAGGSQSFEAEGVEEH